MDTIYNNCYNNKTYNGFQSFPSAPQDWMQHQALMFLNALSLLKS